MLGIVLALPGFLAFVLLPHRKADLLGSDELDGFGVLDVVSIEELDPDHLSLHLRRRITLSFWPLCVIVSIFSGGRNLVLRTVRCSGIH
jgi:hypothetical protein